MTNSTLWREFQSGDSLVLRLLRFLVFGGGILFLCYTAVLPLAWPGQLRLAILLILAALWANRSSTSHIATLTLLLLSLYSTFRYGFWRAATIVAFFRDPFIHWSAGDAFLILVLFLAELYAFLTLGLGYLQVLWPLRRMPVPLPDDPADWPAVDLLIPTVDESLTVLRPTVLAALNIDWPAEKLHVYILDDGDREQVRFFAEEAGAGYIARSERTHAKAGNLNHALPQLQSTYIAVFDSDHVPTRSFLQLTMGWMLRDSRLAMLQTPHHFYSPDPFERNLGQFRSVPAEGELFYRVLQEGNDFWNAASFCGSCAILRRSSLDQVGGFASETLTEDAHTSLRLQMDGWNTAYLNIPQAAGLATERLSSYIRQRIRWAQGMLQVLRLENPLTAPGLSAGQRLCYFHAMAHFLFALPRLIFLTAPIVYLLFGSTVLPGFWGAILAYAVPHLLLSFLCSNRVQGRHRHAFWDQVYETVLAPFLLFPTLAALFSSGSRRFEVTRKGGTVDRDYFDRRIAWPYLLLLALNLAGVFCAIARLIHLPRFHVPARLGFLNWPAHLYAPHQAGIVAVNLVWVLWNIVLLGVAIAVARETQQRRESIRLSVKLPSDILLPGGSMLQGVTSDLSYGGVRTHVSGNAHIAPGDSIKFVFPLLDGSATIPATVVAYGSGELRARFDRLSLQEDESLVTLLYSRADSWLQSDTHPDPLHPLRSLARLLRLSLRGILGIGRRSRSSLASTVAPLLLLAFALTAHTSAQDASQPSTAPTVSAPATSQLAPTRRLRATSLAPATAPTPAADTFAQVLTLSDLGLPPGSILRGNGSSQTLNFSLSRDRLVKLADLKLRYRTAPNLIPASSQIVVTLNGTVVGALAPSSTGALSTDFTLTLPPDLLHHQNQLVFQLLAHVSNSCDDPANSTVWAQLDPASTIELSGSRLTMTSDLASLPLPFYDAGGSRRATVPIVFAAQPTTTSIQAAAIVASWFGALSAPRQLRFPVSIGTIPSGNVILLAERDADLPTSLRDSSADASTGPAIAIRPNPSDPTSSILVVSGSTPDDLLTAARALVLHQVTWQGPRVLIRNFVLPAARHPDDAPRWLRTDTIQTFADLTRTARATEATPDAFEASGSNTVSVPLNLPPDLDYADRENLPLRLDYRYNSVAVAQGSSLQVYLNGAYLSSTPLPHADRASRVLETLIPVPVADLRPFRNLLQFRFDLHPAANHDCATPPASIPAAIVPDSALDLTGISHSAVLPNLQLFASAGFPFTRLADLAETTVVLPSQPTPAELQLLLGLMAHFGAQTGYPALRVIIAGNSSIQPGRDYLVLGTVSDQPALSAFGRAAPVQLDPNGLHIQPSSGLLGTARWWRASTAEQGSELLTSGGLPDALLQQFNWPASSSRSVVAITLRDDSAAAKFLTAFEDATRMPDSTPPPGSNASLAAASSAPGIAHNVTALRDGRFASYLVPAAQYRVGQNTLLERLTRTLQQFPWIIAVVAILFCFLMAILLQAHLRRRARERLHPTPPTDL